MFSTHQQSTYSFYNFGAGNRQQQQQYNEPTDPRWNLEDPRFVSTAEEQLWKLDEPVNYENLQFDARFGVTDYGNLASEQPQKSFPVSTLLCRRIPSSSRLTSLDSTAVHVESARAEL